MILYIQRLKCVIHLLLLMAGVLFGCSQVQPTKRIELLSDWKFRRVGDTAWLPAHVPGCAHTDLLENKQNPDPSYRKNELAVKWIENTDWEYATTFDLEAGLTSFSNVDLQFEGLDTMLMFS
jgi:beta-galactosidase/beta-glucuronidase